MASITNKASQSAITNLHKQAFRKDSPLRDFQQRFPDKYTASQEQLVVEKKMPEALQNVFPQVD